MHIQKDNMFEENIRTCPGDKCLLTVHASCSSDLHEILFFIAAHTIEICLKYHGNTN